jgi:hypothetical protein
MIFSLQLVQNYMEATAIEAAGNEIFFNDFFVQTNQPHAAHSVTYIDYPS